MAINARAFDIREFARFVSVGVIAAIGNITTVWFARLFMSFEIAALAGIASGLTISFLTSKLFAFDSRSWALARGEAARFLTVYSVSVSLYWSIAVVSASLAIAHGVPSRMAEMGGVLAGSAIMMLTSYFGHRFFTYRTYQRSGTREQRAINAEIRRPSA